MPVDPDRMTSSVLPLTEAQQRTLGSLLWQYRSVLERVEFLLEAQLVFASSGRDKRLSSVADLLEEAVATLLGRSSRRISLDQIELTISRILI